MIWAENKSEFSESSMSLISFGQIILYCQVSKFLFVEPIKWEKITQVLLA